MQEQQTEESTIDAQTDNSRLLRYKKLLKLAKDKLPALFGKYILFSVGIKKDITNKLDITSGDTKILLQYYCNQDRYLKLQTEGAIRYNIDNQPEGSVTKIEAQYCAKKLELREAKKKAKQPQEI